MLSNSVWTGGALTGLAGLLVYGFGLNNPNPLRWACLLVLIGILGSVWITNGARILFTPLVCAALAFVSYVALSLLWSADWREGVMTLQATGLLALVLIGLSFLDRYKLARCVSLTACVASVLSLAIHLSRPDVHGGLGNENFQAEFLVLLVPLCAIGFFVFEGIVGWICLSLSISALAQALFLTPSDSKWIGLLGLMFLSIRLGLRWCIGLVIAGAFMCIALIQFVPRIQASIAHRAELVVGTLMMWLDRPLLGAGAGSFNYLYPFYQDAHTRLFTGRALYNVTLYAGAAHNEFVQALAVFGLAGCFLGGLVLYVILKHRERDPVATCALASLAIFAGVSVVGFPLQNPSTAILGVVALGLVAKPWDRAVAFDLRRFWHLVGPSHPGREIFRGRASVG